MNVILSTLLLLTVQYIISAIFISYFPFFYWSISFSLFLFHCNLALIFTQSPPPPPPPCFTFLFFLFYNNLALLIHSTFPTLPTFLWSQTPKLRVFLSNSILSLWSFRLWSRGGFHLFLLRFNFVVVVVKVVVHFSYSSFSYL